ncbi:hypothetical protein K2173_025385 [Erythroxylum novogranatense]|uniref:C2 domain-containing protein n=1 Tax=Erythroxylum novogranatense TaxID=1862640 RepID=A0AAV8UHQ0_9ROSI|nr:hypothetical protein K2173_025385 [Erythroxylum novogranatense]
MRMELSVNSMETKKGILEILLVQAEGIRHTNLLGRPAYYVIVQCGTHLQRSKVTRVSGLLVDVFWHTNAGKDEKAWWNQKFVFEFPLIDWKHQTHLKLRIMDKEFLSRGGFVGETIIYIGGIISEGIEKGNLAVKPSSYNVVLEDDTFKGEIKIGFKFLASKEVSMETKSFIAVVNNQPRQSVSRSIRNLWNFSWWRFWFYSNRTIHACK